MRIANEIVDKIAGLVLQRLKNKELVLFKAEEVKVRARIEAAILADLRAEDALDAEVEGMLRSHSEELDSEGADYRKLFSMIKGRLVRERELII
ncbi:MAG: DUF507 family protein [Proteobacteria bacterium]|nr:DUF507 family protein [Pseudomonadota bacterium]